MRIALFAADVVGAEIARFLAAAGTPLACLVLSARDIGGQNAAIRESLAANAEETLTAQELWDEGGVARLRDRRPDLTILAWWPSVLPDEVLRIPRIGTLNLHPSYLPYSRGKHYYFWSIVERAPFGVTIHWAERRVDRGPIAFQRRIATSWSDTGASLYRRARAAMIELFRDSWPAISRGEIPRIPQDDAVATFHRAADLEAASRIDLDATYTARDLLDLLRARTFPPNGGVIFEDGGRRYRVMVDIAPVDDPPLE